MKETKYNLIHFADEQYTAHAPLNIPPEPDSVLRVFMVYKPLEERIEVKRQEIESFERKGFTVVEWGGTMTWMGFISVCCIPHLPHLFPPTRDIFA